ncbi:Uncharacterised protein [Streptococcus pneumoniae]|nr:Uncharacterised protein [Streptococcus pneumoniae]
MAAGHAVEDRVDQSADPVRQHGRAAGLCLEGDQAVGLRRARHRHHVRRPELGGQGGRGHRPGERHQVGDPLLRGQARQVQLVAPRGGPVHVQAHTRVGARATGPLAQHTEGGHEQVRALVPLHAAGEQNPQGSVVVRGARPLRGALRRERLEVGPGGQHPGAGAGHVQQLAQVGDLGGGVDHEQVGPLGDLALGLDPRGRLAQLGVLEHLRRRRGVHGLQVRGVRRPRQRRGGGPGEPVVAVHERDGRGVRATEDGTARHGVRGEPVQGRAGELGAESRQLLLGHGSGRPGGEVHDRDRRGLPAGVQHPDPCAIRSHRLLRPGQQDHPHAPAGQGHGGLPHVDVHAAGVAAAGLGQGGGVQADPDPHRHGRPQFGVHGVEQPGRRRRVRQVLDGDHPSGAVAERHSPVRVLVLEGAGLVLDAPLAHGVHERHAVQGRGRLREQAVQGHDLAFAHLGAGVGDVHVRLGEQPAPGRGGEERAHLLRRPAAFLGDVHGVEAQPFAQVHLDALEVTGRGRQVMRVHRRHGQPPVALRRGGLAVLLFEPQDRRAEHAGLGQATLHPRLEGAEVLAHHDDAGPLGLEREHGEHRLVVVLDVRALGGAGALRDPPQAEQPQDVVHPDAARAAQHGAQHVPERGVAGLGQTARMPGVLRPVLAQLVEQLRRRADGHGRHQHVPEHPRVRGLAGRPDCQVHHDAHAHAGRPGPLLHAGELLGGDPLHPAVQVDVGRAFDADPLRLDPARRPGRVGEIGSGAVAVQPQDGPEGEVVQARAGLGAEPCVGGLALGGAGHLVHAAQRGPQDGGDGGPIDPAGALQLRLDAGAGRPQLRLLRGGQVGELGDRGHVHDQRREEPTGDGGVGGVRRMGAGLDRVQGVQQQEVGTVPGDDLGQGRHVRRVADAPRVRRGHRVALRGRAPAAALEEGTRRAQSGRGADQDRGGGGAGAAGHLQPVPARGEVGGDLNVDALAFDAVHEADLGHRLAHAHLEGPPVLRAHAGHDRLARGHVARHGQAVAGPGGHGGREHVPPGGRLRLLQRLGQSGDPVRTDRHPEGGEHLHEGLVRHGLGRAVLPDVLGLHPVGSREPVQQCGGFQGHQVLHAVVRFHRRRLPSHRHHSRGDAGPGNTQGPGRDDRGPAARRAVREGGLELTSTPSRRESRPSVLPHEINDLRHLTCG